jgi:ribosome-interacting GTPase 1
MPANLSPEYKAAELAFRKARDSNERLVCLREMLRTIPKHKGTDHLQADIKTRIKELTEELAGPKKGGARGGPATVVHPEGAAQIALLGAPNAGKSSLHTRLTGSDAPIGPYPFTTQYPQPGMMPHLDIHFQLVDLPPISPEHPVPWIANALQPADAALLLVDLANPECVDQVLALLELLAERKIRLSETWPAEEHEAAAAQDADEIADPFATRLPTLMLATKTDRIAGIEDELGVFRELTGLQYPALQVSAVPGGGLEQLGPWLFEHLALARIYTKAPGRAADMDRPFTIRRGQTVGDVAKLVHKDLAHGLRFARVWGPGHFAGQQVGSGHPLLDGDIIELHI